MKKVLISLIFLSMIMAMTNISSMGAQINVPADYSSIQKAIEEAGDGDVIIVQPGTYKESIDFLGKAITLKGTDPNNPDIVAATVLYGRQQRVVIFQNEEGNDTVLSGFTIMNGYSNAYVEPDGAGILCGQDSSPVISHCIIRENTAMGTSANCGGGGIACAEGSSPIISHCTIIDNTTYADGGGIYCGFDSSPVISYCTISGNNVAGSGGGGGIYCMKGAFPTITHCTISGNSCTNKGSGGGISFAGTGGSPTINPDLPTSVISHCTITENTSLWYGGGIYCSHILDVSIIISNCRINKNTASGGGGISIMMNYSPITITNCAIEENSNNGIYCNTNHSLITINECIILKNTAAVSGGGIVFKEAMFILTKCIIKENVSYGTNLGNGGGGIVISGDPKKHAHISNCIITKNLARSGGYFI